MAKVREMTDAEVRRNYEPNWQRKCWNCGCVPSVPVSGLCGPCHFGTARALDGGWWDDKAKTIKGDMF